MDIPNPEPLLPSMSSREILHLLCVAEYGPMAPAEFDVVERWQQDDGVTITMADGHLSFSRGRHLPSQASTPWWDDATEWVLAIADGFMAFERLEVPS